MSGTLFLLPNVLMEEAETSLWLPAGIEEVVNSLDGLFAESEKGGRKFLNRWRLKGKLQEFLIEEINEHTTREVLQERLQHLMAGETWGIVSDAGLPCIADPGSELVRLARLKGVAVKALAGPSSITMALMLSGLPSQRFDFNGYLERKPEALMTQLRSLEKRPVTQIFIEAPYRSLSLFKTCLDALKPDTLLAYAIELTGPEEEVRVKTVREWKKEAPPNLHKKRTIFLISFKL
jgi:16S rRNA (cytidine1402-2'-O)-methyltransferase